MKSTANDIQGQEQCAAAPCRQAGAGVWLRSSRAKLDRSAKQSDASALSQVLLGTGPGKKKRTGGWQ